MKRGKRGISAIIGALILVVFVLAASAVYFLWIKNIVARAQLQTTEEKKCFDTDVQVSDFCHEDLNVMNIQTGILEEKTRIQFNARNNNPNIPINGFIIRLDYGSGNLFSISTITESEIGDIVAKRVISDFIQNSENIKRINVVPKITYEHNKTTVCDKKETIFDWGKMKPC